MESETYPRPIPAQQALLSITQPFYRLTLDQSALYPCGFCYQSPPSSPPDIDTSEVVTSAVSNIGRRLSSDRLLNTLENTSVSERNTAYWGLPFPPISNPHNDIVRIQQDAAHDVQADTGRSPHNSMTSTTVAPQAAQLFDVDETPQPGRRLRSHRYTPYVRYVGMSRRIHTPRFPLAV